MAHNGDNGTELHSFSDGGYLVHGQSKTDYWVQFAPIRMASIEGSHEQQISITQSWLKSPGFASWQMISCGSGKPF